MDIPHIRIDPQIGRQLYHCAHCKPQISFTSCGQTAFILLKGGSGWRRRIHIVRLSKTHRMIDLLNRNSMDESSPKVGQIVGTIGKPDYSCLLAIGDQTVAAGSANHFEGSSRPFSRIFWRESAEQSRISGQIQIAYSNEKAILFGDGELFEIFDFENVAGFGRMDMWSRQPGQSEQPTIRRDLRAPTNLKDYNCSWRISAETVWLCLSPREEGAAISIWKINFGENLWQKVLAEEDQRLAEFSGHRKVFAEWKNDYLVLYFVGDSVDSIILFDGFFLRRIDISLPDSQWFCSGVFAAQENVINIVYENEDIRCVQLDLDEFRIPQKSEAVEIDECGNEFTDELETIPIWPSLPMNMTTPKCITISPCGRLLLAAFGSPHLLLIDLLLNEYRIFRCLDLSNSSIRQCLLLSAERVLLNFPEARSLSHPFDYFIGNLNYSNGSIELTDCLSAIGGSKKLLANNGEYLIEFDSEFEDLAVIRQFSRIGWIRERVGFVRMPSDAQFPRLIGENLYFLCNSSIWVSALSPEGNAAEEPQLLYRLSNWFRTKKTRNYAANWIESRLIVQFADCSHQHFLFWIDVETGQSDAKRLDSNGINISLGIFPTDLGIYILTDKSRLQSVRINLRRPESLFSRAQTAFRKSGLPVSLLPSEPLIPPIFPLCDAD